MNFIEIVSVDNVKHIINSNLVLKAVPHPDNNSHTELTLLNCEPVTAKETLENILCLLNGTPAKADTTLEYEKF